MSIGNRIAILRKSLNFSQEYIAEQLNVSRQAVSKWEKDISKPDTSNLIALASVLNTTVEYLANGNEISSTPRKNLPRKSFHKIIIALIATITIIQITATVIYIHTRPVSWDTGVCSGGFVTHIFNKYSKELTETFLSGMGDDKENVINIKAIPGSQNANWQDNEIFLQFDVEYEHKYEGTIKQRLHFTGKRIWIETYKWSGAIIEG